MIAKADHLQVLVTNGWASIDVLYVELQTATRCYCRDGGTGHSREAYPLLQLFLFNASVLGTLLQLRP